MKPITHDAGGPSLMTLLMMTGLSVFIGALIGYSRMPLVRRLCRVVQRVDYRWGHLSFDTRPVESLMECSSRSQWMTWLCRG